MSPQFLKFIVSKFFGTLLRKGFTILGAWLLASGAGQLTPETQTNLIDVVCGLIVLGVSFAWSIGRSYLSAKQVQDLQGILNRFGFTKEDAGRDPNPMEPPKVPPAALVMLFSAFLVGASGCQVIGGFDQNSYDSALSLKTESLALMQKATVKADQYTADIEALKVKLSAQLAYQEGKGKSNLVSAAQWKIIVSPESNLLGKFLQDWQADKKFSPAYLLEKRQQVSDAFDQVIYLEGRKTK